MNSTLSLSDIFRRSTANKINNAQMRVLLALKEELEAKRPSLTVGNISSLLGYSNAGGTFALDSLENRKLIRREHAKDDRRTVNILITPAGLKLVDEILGTPAVNIGLRYTR